MGTNHPYQNRRFVLTSKHCKKSAIEPAFKFLHIELEELALDTDQLGTFSGEVERIYSPLETAITKAKLGMEATGNPLGLASEGSIGADPFIPWIQSDFELIVFVDMENDLIIKEFHRSNEIIAATAVVRAGEDLAEFLQRADFPRHRLIAKSEGARDFFTLKGIGSFSELQKAIEECSLHSPTQQVRLESDFRAMYSPSRMENIRTAATKLARRVESLCPACNCPGWGVTDYAKGVDCNDCGAENPDITRQELLGCAKCDYSAPGKSLNKTIEAAQCIYCNP